MSRKLTMISSAVALLCGSAAGAADFSEMFSFRGFGTLGVAHSSEENADFRGGLFQPEGAGYTHEWDMRPDSRIAGQISAKFNDKLSAVVQAVSQYQHDGTFKPQIEWANIKYQVTPEIEVRVGRIALPNFMISESRFVGYANPEVRPPQELYFVASITSNDGIDSSYSFSAGNVTNTVRAFYGSSEIDMPTGSIEADDTWGLNYTAQFGAATMRAGYVDMTLQIDVPSSDPLFAGLNGLGSMLSGFGYTAEGSAALALANKYRLEDMNVSFLSVGASYDPGAWFVNAEGLQFGGDGFLTDARAAYVTAGYRVRSFTPYVSLATLKADIPFEPGIPTAGLPDAFAGGAAGLNAGLNTTLSKFNASQSTIAAGLRWDFHRSAALKVQYEQVDLGNDSAGRMANTQPGFVPGSKFDVISIAIDFIL